MSASADDQYEQTNDAVGAGVPAGDSKDNDYASRTGQSHIPVQKDEKPVEDPIDPATADSDATLGQLNVSLSSIFFHGYTLSSQSICIDITTAADDKDAIDSSNIIGGRTRGAGPRGGYSEPGDEEGLPGPDDGTSNIRTGR
ncbi:MAG: hypothetical protein M1812_000398 [Candelaria pacifica]|nr:MAG: hypothetical protein M1812_000398 [Candelaria pacifica]